jgi:hypothetical protein
MENQNKNIYISVLKREVSPRFARRLATMYCLHAASPFEEIRKPNNALRLRGFRCMSREANQSL